MKLSKKHFDKIENRDANYTNGAFYAIKFPTNRLYTTRTGSTRPQPNSWGQEYIGIRNDIVYGAP